MHSGHRDGARDVCCTGLDGAADEEAEDKMQQPGVQRCIRAILDDGDRQAGHAARPGGLVWHPLPLVSFEAAGFRHALCALQVMILSERERESDVYHAFCFRSVVKLTMTD